MSSLLERAIIDATALKEAALKNAESLVIEKYSQEVKTAVESLLEATEEDLFADEDPMTDEADPFSLETGTGAGDEFQEDEEDPYEDSIVKDIPDAFDPDLEDPDDEVIRIDLPSLRPSFPEEEEEIDPLSDIGISIDDEDDIDLDLSSTTSFDEPPVADTNMDISPEMVAEVLADMNLDEDLDIEEVMEAVRIDFNPVKSGWAGTPEPVLAEYESMILAKEQDTKTKEENAELRKTMASLQKENKILISAADKLHTQNKKYTTAFETLQEKLETTNVSNAKLLYINRTLENASLNERQKQKIVESISKATTVQEAKIIFTTLQETVTSSPAEKKPASLNEVVSKRSTLLVAAREGQKRKTEVNPAFERLRRLAGLKQ
jgi:hypothetical protein